MDARFRPSAERVRTLAAAKRHFFAFIEARAPRHKDRDLEQDFMQSGELVRAVHGGEHLEVRTWGRGPSVLFVHGLYLSGGKFRLVIPALVEAGLRAVAVDLPGHG